ncbi:MAG: hypothetical protein IH608_02675, partial [Proteobacteria bacterium]|nr:hypothetical protein [Pseudomonadota bacterium]
QYYFLCTACDEQQGQGLANGGWRRIRDGEPARCNACALKCALTVQRLWAAPDEARFAVCGECPYYDPCVFKGRHYC